MTKVPLSKTAFEHLVKQLVEIEEQKQNLLDEYFPANAAQRKAIELYINNYIVRIEQLLSNSEQLPVAANRVPFVLIGSEVTLQDMLSGENVFKYHLISPCSVHVKEGDVSFLSSLGQSLLLKKVGDTAPITTPQGIRQYQISSILLPVASEPVSKPVDSKLLAGKNVI